MVNAIHRGAAITALPALGVGFSYMTEVPGEFYDTSLIDFVEVTPETLCREIHRAGKQQIIPVPEQLAVVQSLAERFPLVLHGVQLSIGSVHGWNQAYLRMLDQIKRVLPFLWHSEHLSYQTIADEQGHVRETGIALPLPATREVANMVSQRCRSLLNRYDLPFLLENPAHYFPAVAHESGSDEFRLMNQICDASGCGMLLDLHNLYCNAYNHGFDAWQAVQSLNLSKVVEIHVSGGRLQDGYWTDAHEGRVPEPVWRLLEQTLPRCPNIAGVLFEVFPDYAPRLGLSAIREELSCLRHLWQRYARGHIDDTDKFGAYDYG